MITATEGGAARLFYSGAGKLATSASGISVTGSVTADGLVVDGAADINGDLEVGSGGAGTKAIVIAGSGSSTSVMDLKMFGGGTGNPTSILRHSSATKDFSLLTGNSGAELTRLLVTEGGDISFYNAAGNSQSLFWDASAESLGIGTTTPNVVLHTVDASGTAVIALDDSRSNVGDTASVEFRHNGITGSLVKSSAIEDFSVSGNRSSDLQFWTRNNGTQIQAANHISSRQRGNRGGSRNPLYQLRRH